MRPLLKFYQDHYWPVGRPTVNRSPSSDSSCVCDSIQTHGKTTSKTMAKQKVEIEVDVPNGYEFVRLDQQFDYAAGERAFDLSQDEDRLEEPTYVICRPTWQWPTWLTANWIAMDDGGKWYAYSEKPKLYVNSGTWCCDGGYSDLGGRFIDFNPPLCNDWTQSLHQNPRSK